MKLCVCFKPGANANVPLLRGRTLLSHRRFRWIDKLNYLYVGIILVFGALRQGTKLKVGAVFSGQHEHPPTDRNPPPPPLDIRHHPEAGTGQGDPLLPALFSLVSPIVIYPIKHACPSAIVLMYADDLIVFFPVWERHPD